MADLRGFDANTVEPSAEFDPLPPGKYLAIIVETDLKPTQSGNGNYLELTFEILEGQYKGRKVWARLNLDNPSEQAVKIARSELSAICRAVGVMTPNDSVELHNLPLVITVRCKKRKDTGEIANEVKGYEKKEAAAGQPQQAATSTPPWRR
jgi:hypothetical protein